MSTQTESAPLDLNGPYSLEIADLAGLPLPSPQESATRIAENIDKSSLQALPVRDVSASGGAEMPDIEFDQVPSDADVIREVFLHRESRNLVKGQWWVQLDALLARGGLAENERSHAQRLIRAHSFDMQVESQPTDERVTVYECGSATQDSLTAEELESFKQALTVIDQLSSGALLQSKAARTIILLEGVPLFSEGRRVVGLATDDATYVDISFLRQEKFGAKFSPMLGGVLVHEILGHQLESLLSEGKMDYFKRHFHYSDEKVPDERGGLVHAEVIPRNNDHANSKPVRPYGYANNREDLATSVEAIGAVLMGWEQEYNKIPSVASTLDKHRSELVTDFLRKAAHWNGRPEAEGVATPITYSENEATGQLKVAPTRVFEHRDLDREEVITTTEQHSQDRLNKRLSNKTEITYALTSSAVW